MQIRGTLLFSNPYQINNILHFTSILQFYFSRTIKNYHKQKNLSRENCENCENIIDFLQKINNAIPQERALFDTAIKQFITGQSGTEYFAFGLATVKP